MNQITPASIVHLCLALYRHIETVLFLFEVNKLSIANMTTKECYNYAINKVIVKDKSIQSIKRINPSNIPLFGRNGFGRCLIPNFNFAPAFSECEDSSFAA